MKNNPSVATDQVLCNAEQRQRMDRIHYLSMFLTPDQLEFVAKRFNEQAFLMRKLTPAQIANMTATELMEEIDNANS